MGPYIYVILLLVLVSIFSTFVIFNVYSYIASATQESYVLVHVSIIDKDELLVSSDVVIRLPNGVEGKILVVNESVTKIMDVISNSTFIIDGKELRPVSVRVGSGRCGPDYGDLVFKVILS